MSYRTLGAPPPGPTPQAFVSPGRESVYGTSFALPYYGCFQTCADELRMPASYCRVACAAGKSMPHPPMGDYAEFGIGGMLAVVVVGYILIKMVK